jgi:hypothetical protein
VHARGASQPYVAAYIRVAGQCLCDSRLCRPVVRAPNHALLQSVRAVTGSPPCAAIADDGIGRKLLGPLGLCVRMAAIGIAVSREDSERSTPILVSRTSQIARSMFHIQRQHRLEAIVLAVLLAAFPLPASGQNRAYANDVGLGHGLAGAGLDLATDDDSERVRFPDKGSGSGSLWFVHGTVFVGRRIGVGIEVIMLGAVTGSYNALCCLLTDKEKENALLATARWRTLRRSRIGLDAVGGIGAMFQHRETRTSLRFLPNSETVTTEGRHSPGFVLGIDAPVVLVPHLAVSPVARLYFLQRGTRDGANVAFASSRRFALGITAGVGW